MINKLILQKDLDKRLDAAAEAPDDFQATALEICAEFDARDADLEIRSPDEWRTHNPTTKTSFAQQFRADVDAIQPLDRKEEARLARRIEFARTRLEKARSEEGLTPTVGKDDPVLADKRLPRRVSRRAMELHALRTEMVERNLYLVLINVERYAQTGASRLDLIQEGCVSLFRAVDGFDWRRGLLFRTYAVHWLNQAFRNFLYNSTSTVRVPVYLQKALKHINQATIRIGDPDASPKEIAQNSDLNENLVASAIKAARGSFSIDADHSDNDEGSRLRDLLVDQGYEGPYETRIEDVSLQQGLDLALAQLSERERFVVKLRFGIGTTREYTLAEVAKKLGVSVERVRQIQVRAVAKLNTPKLKRELDPYLN